MSAAAWITLGLASLAVVTLATVVWILLALFRQNGRLMLRLEALEKAAGEARTGISHNGSSGGQVVFPWGAKPGEPAPAFRLPDLTGALFDLSDLRGQQTVLLFWDPDSPLCQAMLGDLREWERNRSSVGPSIVLISAGGHDAKTPLGLSSLILLDESSDLKRQFGIPGTPSAVLLDAENRVASGVAIGADAIRELARPETVVR